jgi:5-methyltetrahydropteroyltriglutamate--homocysteine methyltransferase
LVHLCFGNSGGQRIQSGGWDGLMNYPNSLHVAHIVIECRNWPGDGLAVFRDLWLEIGIGLGVVDVKVTEVESAEQIAQDLEWAATMLGDGRVTHVYPVFVFGCSSG